MAIRGIERHSREVTMAFPEPGSGNKFTLTPLVVSLQLGVVVTILFSGPMVRAGAVPLHLGVVVTSVRSEYLELRGAVPLHLGVVVTS